MQPNLLIKFLICLENSYEAYEWLHFLTKRLSKHYHKTILLLKYPKVQFKYAKYITAKIVLFTNEWMKRLMMHLYSALLCIVVHPKRFTIMWGGGGLSSTTTSVQHPLRWSDGCHWTTVPVRSPHTSYRWRGEIVIEPIKWMRSPHTSYRWRGEKVIEPIKWMRSPHTSYRWRGERVIEPIKWMGIIRRPWLTRASGRNLSTYTVYC